jgi:hypothetical protein
LIQVREVFSTILQFREIIVSIFYFLLTVPFTNCNTPTNRTISITTPCPNQRGWTKCGTPPVGYTPHPAQLTFNQFLRFASFSGSIAMHLVSACRLSCKRCSPIQIWIVVSLGYGSHFLSFIVRKRIGRFLQRRDEVIKSIN